MQSVKRDACENVEEWSVKVEPCKSGTKWKMSGTFVTLVNVGDSAALKRVKKKVEKLRKLDNCFIVQYFGLAKPNSSRYIVSEISDGSLADYVENKLINIGDIEDHVVINQVAIALSYLHAKCIVHWRLEPEDIHLIRHSSELITAKIGYFKVHSVQQDRRWMAPEANSDQFHPTKASNVWDLGMLTIFLITRGKMEAADIEEIKARDLTERLTNTNPKRRPPAHMIAYHPYFLTSTPSRSHFAGRINRLSIYPQILCVITSNTKVMAWYEKQNDKWKEDESSLTDLLKAAKMIRKCAERLFLTNVEEEEFISQDSTVNASTSDPLPILVDKLLVAAVPLFDLYFWSCLCALGLEKAKKIFLMSDVQFIVVRSSTELLHGRQPPSAEDDVVQSAIDARRPEMITFLFYDWHFKPKSGWLHDIIGREWVSSELLASVLKFGFDSNWNDSNRRTVLHLAARVNQKPTKEIVQLLLDHGADPDLTDESNRKPLHFAVSFSNPETVRLLLKATSRPLTKCKGWTLLHLAALFQADSPEISRLLLNEGQNPNATDNMRDTPLHLATQDGRKACPETIQTLIDYGADPNRVNQHGKTPLHAAVVMESNGAAEIVEILLKAGSNPNQRDIRYHRPLHGAVDLEKPCLQVVEMLLDYGSDVHAVDEYDRTPLHLAASCNEDPTIAQLLVERGANVNQIDCVQRTPLHLAVENGRSFELIEYLASLTENLNYTDTGGNNLLSMAVENDNPKIVKLLLDKGVNPDCVDQCNRNALSLASCRSPPEIFQMLSEKTNLSLGCVSRAGSSPLHIAAANPTSLSADFVKTLLDEGLDPNTEHNEILPLHGAISASNFETVKLLWSVTSVEPAKYASYLSVACSARKPSREIVRFLLDRGCDPNELDQKGSKPLHHAAKNSTYEIVQLLLEVTRCPFEPTGCGENLLHLALSNDTHPSIKLIKFLLKNKLDLGATDDSGRTPLHCAASHTTPEIFQMLFEKFKNSNDPASALKADHYGRPLIHHAAENDRFFLRIFKFLVKRGFDPNAVDKENKTVLHLMTRDDNLTAATLKLLVESGVDPNVRTTSRKLALHSAAENCTFQVFSELLKVTDDATQLDKEGKSILHYAASSQIDSTKKIEAILKQGIDPNIADETQRTALFNVTIRCDQSAFFDVQLLLDAGANVNLKDADGKLPLHMAVAASSVQVIDKLFQVTDRPHQPAGDGRTILHWVVCRGDIEETLIKPSHSRPELPLNLIRRLCANTNVNVKDDEGRTPLLYAVRHMAVSPCVTKLLLDCGADVNVRDKYRRTPLVYTCMNRGYPSVALVRMLLEYGACMQGILNGRSALHYAAGAIWCGVPTIVEYLIDEMSLNVNEMDRFGLTPLHMAALSIHNPRPEMFETLLSRGADPNAVSYDGLTVLHRAAHIRNKPSAEVIKVLLKAGADPLKTDPEGRTPLHYAVLNWSNPCPRVIRALIEGGADPNAADRFRVTPLHCAARNPSEKAARIIALLLKLGANPDGKDVLGRKPLELAETFPRPCSPTAEL